MSAITTKIVEKYNLSSKTSLSELSQYTSEFLKNLTDDRKRNQARRRLRDGFKFNSEQVSILIPNQRGGKSKAINVIEGSCKMVKISPPERLDEEIIATPKQTSNRLEVETIGEMAHRILQDRLSVRDVKAEAYADRKSVV